MKQKKKDGPKEQEQHRKDTTSTRSQIKNQSLFLDADRGNEFIRNSNV